MAPRARRPTVAEPLRRPLSELRRLLAERDLLVRDAPAGADPSEDPIVSAVVLDSRRVSGGSLFASLPGQHVDGRSFATEAVARGAVAVVAEAIVPDLGAPQLVVRDGRAALALAAAWHAGFPSLRLGIVGVTGTDGKTTTAYLVRAALEAAGHRSGLVGTTDVIVGGRELGNPARMTTPEAPELQAHLAAMLAAGDDWAVVESTSHGLAQQRVAELAYDVGVLTNVTSEHLELHGTREAYVAAKRRLFTLLATSPANPDKGFGKHAVVNADDPEAGGFVEEARRAGAGIVTYGLDRARDDGAPPSIVATDISTGPHGTVATVRTPRWEGAFELGRPGRFNLANALAALGVAEALGLDPARSAAAVGASGAVPGRMERIDRGQPFDVIVDYAHTAEALATVLDELRPPPVDGAGLIAVFGSAGERDTHKRAEMGRVAGERCRLIVVTDEDPRREDRMSIIEAIAGGARDAGRRDGADLFLVPDRAEAIDLAIGRARPGDVVLLAGKGHERTIEMADGARPWDETAAAVDALAALGWERPPGG
jgi:UDP-N-acetylmuramoyl-L-alanyl-D-glutamate--2,6-diaminopimelate ligase